MIPYKHKFLIMVVMAGLLGACAGGPRGERLDSDPAIQANQRKIATLQHDLSALNGHTDAAEARQVAQIAVQYSAHLAEEYKLVRPPAFHNVLVRVGFKERGLCHHWTADLMKALEKLDLKSFQLYWGVAHRGSELREHNTVVIAARGRNFEDGLVLDAWRNSGELFWRMVKEDRYPWQERPRSEW
jgi:hypothetical protein